MKTIILSNHSHSSLRGRKQRTFSSMQEVSGRCLHDRVWWSISSCRWARSDITGRPTSNYRPASLLCVSVSCNTCTYTVCPPVFLNIEGSCVSYCREWKMPFTLWYGRSGCTGSINSARKKRLRAVSSLKSVLWCERGKCMQPRAHQLYVCVCVFILVGIVEKAMGEDT